MSLSSSFWSESSVPPDPEQVLLDLARAEVADPDLALRQVLGAGAGALRAAGAGLWLAAADTAGLVCRAFFPEGAEPAGDAPGAAAAAEHLGRLRPLRTLVDQPAATGRRTRLDAAVWNDAEPVGWLRFERPEADPWTPAERLFAAALADRAALVLAREQRRTAERDLLEQRRQVAEVQMLARLGSWEWEIATNQVTWTDELYRMYGLEPRSEPGTFESYLARVHPDDRERVRQTILEAYRTGSPFDFTERIVLPDGDVRVLHSRGRVLTDASGRAVRLVGTCQNITDRVRADEALRASEESYRTIFDLAGDAIFVHDPRTGAVLDANRKACELYGCTVDDLKRDGLARIAAVGGSFSADRALDLLRQAAAGEPQGFEWLSYHGDGSPLWVEVSLHRVSILGEERVLAGVRDITARKHAEEALQRAYDDLEQRVHARTAELAEANRALEAEIGERARAEGELRRRTSELEAVFRALPDLYFRLSPDGTVLDQRSGSDAEQYALPSGFPEQLVGKRADEILPPEAHAHLRQAMVEVLSTGLLACVEYRLTIDGEPRDFETRILPLEDGTFSAIVRDISERKQSEQALRESESRYRTLIEQLPAIIYIASVEEGNPTIFASPQAEQLLGYSDEEWRSNPRLWLERIHPDDRGRVERDWDAAHSRGNRLATEYRMITRDGRVIWFRDESVLIRSEAGEPLYIQGVMLDITERRLAEEKLRFQTTLLEAQNHAAIDGILVARDGRVLSMNPRYAEIFNVPAELRDPERCEEMFRWACAQAADPEGYRDKIARLRADADAVHRDEVLLADGRVLDRYTAPLRSRDGQGYGRIWMVRDITDRKRTEQALRAAKEDAERADRAKSEFLSRMSHELRTPMNSILGFAQLLGRASLPPEHRRSVQHILKAGRHLLHLINEVLEIARIESGRHNLSLEPVRLGQVLQEAVGLVRPLAAQLQVELDEGPWGHGEAFVRADRQRLSQVLLNLLSNAIKYNHPGGWVRVSCEPCAGADGEARLCVRVRDTGGGIPADRVAQLFTPFARLGAEQTEVEGTGLGLALSQRLAEAMEGSLRLEETGPQGSVFRLDLLTALDPLVRLEDPEIPEVELEEVPHAPATLLYIEDNLANLSLVETILQSRPKWRILPALQGQLGVELAREHSPQLILLDLHLPDINGAEVLRRLRADERTARTPVVIISADATRDALERLRASGANAYLTKPLDIDEFMSTIERFLPSPE